MSREERPMQSSWRLVGEKGVLKDLEVTSTGSLRLHTPTCMTLQSSSFVFTFKTALHEMADLKDMTD